LYLLHVLRKRLDYPELKRAVRDQSERFHPASILIEDKASGTQLIQELIREGFYGVTRYEPTMDKIMRLHSVTSTIENGFVYLPTQADWLPSYLHELTTFPGGKYDDQADSTSQALDWVKQGSQTYGLIEYLKQENMKINLNLDPAYRFVQCNQGEPIIAVHNTTGQKIRWQGQSWVDHDSGLALQRRCPKCDSTCIGKIGPQNRCMQCGEQWPPVKPIRPAFSRRGIF
jgi:predicted phage terminase large subunit-like protein